MRREIVGLFLAAIYNWVFNPFAVVISFVGLESTEFVNFRQTICGLRHMLSKLIYSLNKPGDRHRAQHPKVWNVVVFWRINIIIRSSGDNFLGVGILSRIYYNIRGRYVVNPHIRSCTYNLISRIRNIQYWGCELNIIYSPHGRPTLCSDFWC